MLETVQVSHAYPHPAAMVWQLTGDFAGLKNWLPGVVQCTVTGSGPRAEGGDAERSVEMLDGSVTREALERFSETDMRYEYSILAAKGFRHDQEFSAQFRVQATAEDQCEVHWGATFSLPDHLTPDQIARARERVTQMYRFFLSHLATLL